jgi:hypothetical protein
VAEGTPARPETEEAPTTTELDARLARLEQRMAGLVADLQQTTEVHEVAFPVGPVRALRVRLGDGRLLVLVDEALPADERQAAVNAELEAEAHR